ncbi:MAG: transcriptional regulator, TetR family, partial [Verrucomicrobiaceae bacterium]|nr:transcriptional regulator, TetR family [Verrucomicrobiaceae bacterium]
MKSSSNAVCAGRPRAFDTDAALEKAMKVFWQKGYEGTSLADLTEAMGINRPSLYAAYGNKEELFRKALDLYGASTIAYFAKALEEPTARAVIERLLYSSADLMSNPDNPRGCLVLQAALCCGDDAENVRQDLQTRRLKGQDLIRCRLERARQEGDLPSTVNPADLARYVSIVMNGLSIQASNGAKCDEMKRAIEIA